MKQLLPNLAYWLTIKPRMKRLKKLLPEAEIHPCGSRYVCNPPVFSTDIDFLVYSEDSVSDRLIPNGWEESDFRLYFNPQDKFVSWRKGRVNLIVTTDRGFADDHIVATHICKSWNVRRKYNRIMIYEGLRCSIDEGWLSDMDQGLKSLILNLTGQHGKALRRVYRIQHGLELPHP